MKTIRSLGLSLAVTAGLLATGKALAADCQDHDMKMCGQAASGQLVGVTDKTDAAWLSKARADYPVAMCVVSGEKLEGGDMGKAQEFIYKQEGQPDRLVRFCCKGCQKDFNKDPAKYLKKLDEAAAGKSKDMGGMPMK
jgi:YHS domain-containing protein